MRSDCAELIRDELDLLVMGQLLGFLADSEETGGILHNPHSRQQVSYKFLRREVKHHSIAKTTNTLIVFINNFHKICQMCLFHRPGHIYILSWDNVRHRVNSDSHFLNNKCLNLPCLYIFFSCKALCNSVNNILETCTIE